MPFKDSTCIVGIGETPVGKLPGRTPLSFELEAARLAIEDSGLKKSDIDGVDRPHPDSQADPRLLYDSGSKARHAAHVRH